MAGGADHLLLDSVRRRLRQPAGWVAVVLHLSRLTPPAPRPHHRRIARVLMEDAARRHDGTVFALVNGDLLLLSRMGDERRPAGTLRVASPQALPGVLARLMRADVPEPRELVSLWPLETSGDVIMAYAMERVATAGTLQAAPADPRSPPGGPGAGGGIDLIAATLAGPDAASLLRRQVAVRVSDEGVLPLFREVRFSMAALEGRLSAATRAESDPYVFRHLAERLDHRLIALVQQALSREAPGHEALDPSLAGAPRLHLNLTLASLRSEAFARLAEQLLGRGLSLGVELSVLEACADPDRYEQACTALRRLEMVLVLDGVSPQTLRLARIAALEPDFVKLSWSPRMAESATTTPGAEQRLIEDLGAERVILHHAETEAALRWGLEHGIRRFQGRHVDAMLGALRLSACGFARGCTLQQCIGRAASTEAASRRDCRNPELLDAAAPGPRAVVPTSVAATSRVEPAHVDA